MNPAKASWRYKSPRRKLKAIRKLRASRIGREDKLALLTIAGSDPDQGVRRAAAHTLCSLGSIATFIKEELFVSGPDHGEDEQSFHLLDALLESITDDAALFDIVMHAFFSLPEEDGEHEDCPSRFHARVQKICDIRAAAALKISSREMLRTIVGHYGSMDFANEASWNALWRINDRQLLYDIVHDGSTDIQLAIKAAEKLRDDDFLAAVGRDLGHHDSIRLDAVEKIGDDDLRTATLLTILERPQPDGSKFDREARLSALGKHNLQSAAIRPFYEAIARDRAYDMDVRIDADKAAVTYGGASCLNEIYAQALAGSSTRERDKACGQGCNGHRWRYRGAVKIEDNYHRMVEGEEFGCVICGKTAWGTDPRVPGDDTRLQLTDEESAKMAALDAVSGDEAFLGLLEHETKGFAIRRIISRISDVGTLLAIARNSPHGQTRKEAVLEAYERDHAVLCRIDDAELLCVLGKHVTDPDDLRYAISHIEDEQCLFEIGSLMLKRQCDRLADLYLAALAKVSGQTKLAELFSKSLRCGIYSFSLGVLNLIRDIRALGQLWLDRALLYTHLHMIEEKIVNPAILLSKLQSDNCSFREKAIDIMASDPVLQKKIVEHCYAGTHYVLRDTSRMQRILDTLPEGSRAARKLRDKMESRVFSPLEEGTRERACREEHNGHRWRYKGTRYFEYADSLIGEKEEYVCVLCGKAQCGKDPRPGNMYSNEYLSEDDSARIAAVEEHSDDETLVGLLEDEPHDAVIRNIVSMISDTETLLAIARTSSRLSTRKEAVLEAYERDHGILSRIDEPYLLCVLGKHVTDPDDMLYAIERIEDQQCLLEIGWLMKERQCDKYRDIYLAALAKVSDQTKLCEFFFRTYMDSRLLAGTLQPFIMGLLNRINDMRALGMIWMYEAVDTWLLEMVEEKIVNPTMQFRNPESNGFRYTGKAVEKMTATPVVLEMMIARCLDGWPLFTQDTYRIQCVLDNLPEGSEAARKLRAKIQSMT